MKFLERIRNISFWAIDFLKKSAVSKHLKDISKINKSPFSETSQTKRNIYLKDFLNHATKTTNFYKKYNHYSCLADFPIIDKNIIRDNFEDFKSDIYSKKKLIETSTSGSTGTAFKILQDKNKKHRNTADTLYFSKLVGYKIGYKLHYLRHWNKTYNKNKFIGWLQNIVKIDVLDLNNEYIKELVIKLTKNKSNKSWIGFSSAYEYICKILDENKTKPLNINMKSIVAISESLNDYTKERMSYYFNAPIVSRYSNMENGIIAQQKVNESTYKINWASYQVEVLSLKSNNPVNPGEVGRIIITDLFNFGMPIIRYDTGDLGSINYDTNEPCFVKIEGRKTDIIYNTNGEIVSSFLLSSLNKFEGIIQYQLIQELEKTYTLNLNINKLFNKNSKINKELKKFLGNDAIINISYVSTIPLLASGKRKVTVNNYSK